MDTRALDYIDCVDPNDPSLKNQLVEQGDLYIGPGHLIKDTSKFPSPSSIVNESMYKTGIYVPSERCQEFDDEWRRSMTKCFEASGKKSQLDDFIKTGRSSGRMLKLQVMVLPPGTYFKIHAHPNIEFELTIKGTLEESRFQFCMPIESLMPSSSLDVDGDDATGSSNSNNNNDDPSGPMIRSTDTFVHNAVGPGQCMINEVGSVHQSFTSADSSCAILVMWSGCHANIRPENVHCTDYRLKPRAGW